MAPMQDDMGVCVNHKDMCEKISAIYDAVCGDPLANPPIKGMSAKLEILWNKYQAGKEERKFVWQHLLGYILTALCSGAMAIGVLAWKGLIK